MKFFLEKGFLTAYDYISNNNSPLKEIMKETKLFIIHNKLFELFELELKKGSEHKIVPYNENDKNENQVILRLPFNKIFIEPFNEIELKPLKIIFLGLLIEDLGKDWFYFTYVLSRNNIIVSCPLKVHKFQRNKVGNTNDCPFVQMEGLETHIAPLVRMLGYDVSQTDIDEIVGDEIITPQTITTTNMLKGFRYDLTNLFALSTWIISYINSANSEIVYVGNSKEDYQRRISNGKMPVPPAHTIILKNKIINQGFIFNGKKFSPSYLFDIRGHYRTFKNFRYKKMLGKTIWINPFRKGRGDFVKKNYIITRDDIWKQKLKKK